jgi:hypothetical protein
MRLLSSYEIYDVPRHLAQSETHPRYSDVTLVLKRRKPLQKIKKKKEKNAIAETPIVRQQKDEQRRKCKEKQEKTRLYWQAYDQEEKTRKAIDAGKKRAGEYAQYGKFIRTIVVHTADRMDIGMLSSGWSAYSLTLKAKLSNAGKAGVTKANDIAKMWNRTGFKTGSGKMWTPRLVNIAKSEFGIRHGYRIVKQLLPE